MTAGDYLKKYLRDEGFQFKVDDDGDISFKYQGTTFMMTQDSNDSVFAIFLIFKFEGNSKQKIMELCNKFNIEKNLVKFSASDSLVFCTYECLITDGFSVGFLPQILGYLDSVSDDFIKAL